MFRTMPFLAHAIVAPRIPLSVRGFWIFAFGSLVAYGSALGIAPRQVLLPSAIALGYLLLVACAVYVAAVRRSRHRSTRWIVLSSLLFLCLVVPGATFPTFVLAPAIVWGFEVFLSSYSYLVDTDRAPDPGSLGACLEFILVNPQVVYAERGLPVEGLRERARGLGRCCVGVATWLARDVAIALASSRLSRQFPVGQSLHLGSYSAFIQLYTFQFIAYYLMHSGLASIQIGFGTIAGYRLPERYRYAFLSPTPREFWDRWNTWIGSWAKRYIFVPFSLHLRRRRGPFSGRNGAAAIAILLTFACVGLLHDLAASANTSFAAFPARSGARGTLMFLLFGATSALSVGVERAVHRVRFPAILGRLSMPMRLLCASIVLQILLLEHAVVSWTAGLPLTRPGW
jgi:hypothetical protein